MNYLSSAYNAACETKNAVANCYTNYMYPLNKMDQTKVDPTQEMIVDAVHAVFNHLNLNELKAACCVSKTWKKLAGNTQLYSKFLDEPKKLFSFQEVQENPKKLVFHNPDLKMNLAQEEARNAIQQRLLRSHIKMKSNQQIK